MSSKLSKRRAVVQHPKICVAASCPPPTPPTPWPPDSFPLQWIANWWWEEEPYGFNIALDFEPMVPGQYWQAFYEKNENVWDGSFELDYNTKTATLTLAYQGDGDECGCEKEDFTIVWGVSTLYAITTWTTHYPWDSIHEAHFTF